MIWMAIGGFEQEEPRTRLLPGVIAPDVGKERTETHPEPEGEGRRERPRREKTKVERHREETRRREEEKGGSPTTSMITKESPKEDAK